MKPMRTLGLVTLSAGLILGLSACTETELASHIVKQVPAGNNAKSQGKFKVGNPYRVKGKKYYPAEMYEYVETGLASWYGPGFHGKSTANGETYNQYDLTAAHKTLQLPSIVKVTNLENGRSAILRVNDRGPFAHDRVLDVSEKAATVLGFKNKGTAKIKLELMPEESRIVADAARAGRDTRGIEIAMNNKYRNRAPMQAGDDPVYISTPRHERMATSTTSVYSPPPTPQRSPTTYTQPSVASVPLPPAQPVELASTHTTQFDSPAVIDAAPSAFPTGNYYIQVASFNSAANAQNFSRSLGDLGPVTIQDSVKGSQPVYRVKVGPLSNQQQVNNILPSLVERGHPDAIVLVEN